MSSCFIIAYAGSKNLGDDLMLLGVLPTLGEFSVKRVTSKHGFTRFVDRDGVTWVSPSPLKVIAALMKSDVVMICGGTWFHDDVPVNQHLHYQSKLLRVVMLLFLARCSLKRVEFRRVGFGPLQHPLSRWLARIAIGLANDVSVRDQASADVLQTFSRTCEIEPDYGLEYITKHETRSQRELRVVISPVMCRVFASANEAAKFWLRVANEVRSCFQETDVRPEVVFLPFNYSEGVNSDVEMLEQIEAELPVDPNVSFVDWRTQPLLFKDIFDIISGSLCIAGRYHAIAVSSRMAKTTVAMAYHEKCADFANEHNIPLVVHASEWMTDRTHEVLAEAVSQYLQTVVSLDSN